MKISVLLLLCCILLFPVNSSADDWRSVPFYSNEQAHRLSDYKGQTLLVMFWATWCPHCKNQMPALSVLKKLYSNIPDLKIINISIDDGGEERVRRYLATHGLNDLDSYVDANSNLLNSLGFNAIPTLVLISPQSEIAGIYSGLQDFNVKYLEGMIKKNGQAYNTKF